MFYIESYCMRGVRTKIHLTRNVQTGFNAKLVTEKK